MKIDKTLLDNLLKEASASPRLRQNMDLRNSPSDSSQRMLNALLPETVMPIHRHRTTSETVVVLRGKMEEIFYEEGGHETSRVLLEAGGEVQGLCIPVGQWHTVNVMEPTVILECKDGKYEPLSQEDMISLKNNKLKNKIMSTEENVKKLLEYCYNNIRGGFNEPPYTAAFVARDRHMTLEEVLEAIEASSELSSFITTGQLGVKRNNPETTSKSFNDDDLVKQVNYLIGNEIAQGNHTPITADFVAAALHISLSEAEAALKAATEVISGK